MNLILFAHPAFMQSQSMPRFAHMLKSAYESRGHAVTMWSPAARVHSRFAATKFAKWAGYFDQYVLFPREVRRRLRLVPQDSLFVFCDQSMGPWMPLLKSRPHVVHAHDLLALRSALGDFKENPTAFSGRIYQRYIRRGFRAARHFISVSNKTRDDLHRYGKVRPATSEVVYNGLSYPYARLPEAEALEVLREASMPPAPDGMLLHVGGNQWYKNEKGVLSIYARYAASAAKPLPLWCISPRPNEAIRAALAKIPSRGEVHFFQNISNRILQASYSYARACLFPSIAEGFGWPLIEAQACGCAILTTDEPPMTEVAGREAFYLRRLQYGESMDSWAGEGAALLAEMLSEPPPARTARRERGIAWTRQFDSARAIDKYLSIYQRVLENHAT